MFDALRRSRAGLTLVEVMVSVAIVLIATLGIMLTYVQALELNMIGKGAVLASHGVKNKIEEIKSSPFGMIFVNYNNSTFTIPGLTGKGVVYVNNQNPGLLVVKVVFCWRLADGRVIGEDRNLDGVLGAGEDRNANGQIDSYVQITTQIYG